jgi:hypothetical protein
MGGGRPGQRLEGAQKQPGEVDVKSLAATGAGGDDEVSGGKWEPGPCGVGWEGIGSRPITRGLGDGPGIISGLCFPRGCIH